MTKWICVTCGQVVADHRYTTFGHNRPGTIVTCCVPYWMEYPEPTPERITSSEVAALLEDETTTPAHESVEERQPRGGYF